MTRATQSMKFLGITVTMGLAAVAARAQDWPRFLGPNANGFASDKGLRRNWNEKPPTLVWKFAMSDRGYAGPSVAEGKVFIIDHRNKEDILRALDLQNGVAVWSFAYAAPPKSPAYATPVYDSGRLYTVSRQGMVHCVDAKTGQKVWALDMVKEFGSAPPQWEHSWSPLVDGPALILVAGGPEAVVVSVDKGTGRTLWKGGGTDGAGYAPPVAATLGGRNGYVIAALTTIRAVDAANGQTLWTFPWVNQWKVNAPTPVVAGDTVFVTSGYDRGCALLDGKTGRKIWENREISSHFSSPILHEGCLYTTSDPGRLVCMDVKTGKVKWSQPGFEKGGICAADGILIVQDGKNGNLAQVAISPDGYQELGRMKAPLGGQSWTAPILASGRLIIRNKEQLACLDLR